MDKNIVKLIFLIFVVALLPGCSDDKSTIFHYEVGIASLYDEDYHGGKTESGEIYDKNEMTAAHKTLKFGTWVEVSNLDNGYTARVKINDRDNFIEGRILKLSEKAAINLGMRSVGLAQVGINIVSGS